MDMWQTNSWKITLPLCAFSVLSNLGRAAQDPEWVSLDGSAAGTEPSVVFDANASNANVSVFEIEMHGFYRETVVEEQMVFDRLSVPGMGATNGVGKPDLPVLPLMLGVPTDADQVSVGQPEVLESVTLDDYFIYPAQIHQPDTPDNPPPPPFQFDAGAYQSQQPFPNGLAVVRGELGTWRAARVQRAYAHPLQAVSGLRKLIVRKRLRVRFEHSGNPLAQTAVTPRFERTLYQLIDNPQALGDVIHPQWGSYDGCYLIITDPDYEDELGPFTKLKREQGYHVVVWTTTEIGGSDCDDLRDAIADWYWNICMDATGTSYTDAYCLLVGDTSSIGYCNDPEFGKPSDYYLGCVEDDDIYAEVGVGRLSVDNETDCAEQVEKIVRYQDAPPFYPDFYDDVLLCASTDGSGDERFRSSCEEIVDNPYYMYSLDFHERYGDYSSGTVSGALSDIEDGQNIVVYEGHGNYYEWANWDYSGSDLDSVDVQDLSNGYATPIVLSLCCQNSNCDTYSDCVGEKWMEGAVDGCVAHHGALRNAYICHYTLFGPSFFRGLYGDASPTLSELTQGAHGDAYCLNGHSPDTHSRRTWWMFQWLGDPSMKIWQERPKETVPYVSLTEVPIGELTSVQVQITDSGGFPVPNLIVSAFKAGEVQVNRYTDAAGWVDLPVEPATPGELIVRSYADFGAYADARLVLSVVAPFVSFCAGDGSGADCPCMNFGGTGEGCAHESGAGASGARLEGTGSGSLAADDLTFAAHNLPAGQPALLFVGDNAAGGGSGLPFGDGLLCVTGGVVRLGVAIAGPSGSASWGPGLAATGGWAAGDLARFQAWYRTPAGPCGSGFNLTNGAAVPITP